MVCCSLYFVHIAGVNSWLIELKYRAFLPPINLDDIRYPALLQSKILLHRIAQEAYRNTPTQVIAGALGAILESDGVVHDHQVTLLYYFNDLSGGLFRDPFMQSGSLSITMNSRFSIDRIVDGSMS